VGWDKVFRDTLSRNTVL